VHSRRYRYHCSKKLSTGGNQYNYVFLKMQNCRISFSASDSFRKFCIKKTFLRKRFRFIYAFIRVSPNVLLERDSVVSVHAGFWPWSVTYQHMRWRTGTHFCSPAPSWQAGARGALSSESWHAFQFRDRPPCPYGHVEYKNEDVRASHLYFSSRSLLRCRRRPAGRVLGLGLGLFGTLVPYDI
jgi:hypothetical protein